MINTENGDQIYDRATDALPGKFNVFSRRKANEEATELFTKAGHKYNLEMNHDKAATAYLKAAELDEVDRLYRWIDAAKMYKKGKQPDKQTEILNKIICYYLDEGRFNKAADYYIILAEIATDSDQEELYYKKALELFDSKSGKYQCLGKLSSLAVGKSEWDKVVVYQTEMADHCENNSLLRFNTRKHVLAISLALLCQGDTQLQLDRYLIMANSAEVKLIERILEDSKACDMEAFQRHITEWDLIHPMETDTITLLLALKKRIESGEVNFL